MTVGELIKMLKYYDEDSVVVFKPSNSSYVEHFGDCDYREVSKFYGPDAEYLVIGSDGQCGSV